MRRSRVTWSPLAAAALALLVGCSPAQSTVTLSPGSVSTDPADLRDVEWQFQQVVEGGVARDVSGVDGVLRVNRDDALSARGCNSYGGKADVGPGTLTVSESVSTLIGCNGPSSDLDALVQRVLQAGATWSVDDGLLRITGSDVELRLKDRGTPFRRGGTTLAEGSFGDAVYRLSWDPSPTTVGVTWESRDRLGDGLGSSGIGRAVDEKITFLDPSGASVAGRGFVYVPAPRSVARVAFQRADGGSVDLTRYDLDGVTAWSLHAGFVEGVTKGGRTTGYDEDGTVLLRSRVLPY